MEKDDISLLEIKTPYANDVNYSKFLWRNYWFVSDFRSRENFFLDIGLNLDCIGGSRANNFFFAPLGIRNIESEISGRYVYNNVISSVHKKIVCGYGTNPYNFSNALRTMAKEAKENYKVHIVSFNKDISDFVDVKINPANVSANDKVAKAWVGDLYYERGLENYLIRLLDFKKNVRAKIMKFGKAVEFGRKTNFIFLFLSAKQWEEVAKSKELLNTLLYLYRTGSKERFSIIPCAEDIRDIPQAFLKEADMINGYGAKNVSAVKGVVESKNLKFRTEKAFNKLQTVGVTYDCSRKPYAFPLKGWTQEFFLAEEKRKQWEQKEKDDYIKFIKSLDDGSRHDSANRKAKDKFKENRKQMFANAEFMERENKAIPKIKPVIIFE